MKFLVALAVFLSSAGFALTKTDLKLTERANSRIDYYNENFLNAKFYQLVSDQKLTCVGHEEGRPLRGVCVGDAIRKKDGAKVKVALVERYRLGGKTGDVVELAESKSSAEVSGPGSLETYLVDGGAEDVVIDALAKLGVPLKDGLFDGEEDLRCVQGDSKRPFGGCVVNVLAATGTRVSIAVTVAAASQDADPQVQVYRLLPQNIPIQESTKELFNAVNSCGGNDSGELSRFDYELFTPAMGLNELKAEDKRRHCGSRAYSSSQEEGKKMFLKAITKIKQVKDCLDYELSKRHQEELLALVKTPEANLGVFASEWTGKEDDSESCQYYTYAIYTRGGVRFTFTFNYTD